MFGGGARQDLDPDDFKDSIDYKFAQYAINERHFSLNDEDKSMQKQNMVDSMASKMV